MKYESQYQEFFITIFGNFKSRKLEEVYFKETLNYSYLASFFNILTTFYSLCNFIFCVTLINYQKNIQILIICLIILFLSCVFVIFYFKSTTCLRFYFSIYFFFVVFSISHYELNYLIDIFMDINDSLDISHYLLIKEIIFLLIDFVIKQIWIFLPFNFFVYYFLTTVFSYSFIFYIGYLRTKLEKTTYLTMWSAYCLVLFCLVLYSLILQKIKKKKFILKEKLRKFESDNAILHFFNSGYIKFKFSSILVKNEFFEKEKEFFLNFLFKNLSINMSEVEIELENYEKNFTNSDYQEIIKIIFSSAMNLNSNLKFKNEKKNLTFSKQESLYYKIPDNSIGTIQNFDLSGNNNYFQNQFTNILANFDKGKVVFKNLATIYELLIFNRKLYTEFNYFGRSTLTQPSNKILSLEIWVKVDSYDEVHLIFNDISKNDFKNGTMQFIVRTGQYLHDFKNPLICIHNEVSELRERTEKLLQSLNDKFESERRHSSPENSFQENSHIENLEEKFDEMMEKFEYVKQMSDYCQSMIGSYEDFSKNLFKPQNLKIESEFFDLMKMLRFIRKMMNQRIEKSNKNVKFFIQIENFHCTIEERFLIKADESKLKRVLINILSNADKFTLFGSITLKVTFELIFNVNYISFTIEDTGLGMSQDDLKNLFTPFFSLNSIENNKNGCGLGLTIVKEITDKLGKGLKINSELGKGTKVTFDVKDYYNEEKINDSDVTMRVEKDIFSKTDKIQKYVKYIVEEKTGFNNKHNFKKRSLNTVHNSSPLSAEFIQHMESSRPKKIFSDISLIRPRICSPKESKKTINIFNSYMSNASYIYEINKNYSNIQKVQEINLELISGRDNEETKNVKLNYNNNHANTSKIIQRKMNSSRNLISLSEVHSPKDSKSQLIGKKARFSHFDSTLNSSSLQTGGVRRPSNKRISFDQLTIYNKASKLLFN
jgi:signal transduction histidine kinase